MFNYIKQIIIVLSIMMSFSVSADTFITDISTKKDFTFTKADGPYVINNPLTFMANIFIEKDVKIIFEGRGDIFLLASTTLTGKDFIVESKSWLGHAMFSCGRCSMNVENISVSGVSRSFIEAWDYSNVHVKNLDISFLDGIQKTTGIQVYSHSTLVVDSSSFTRLTMAIYLSKSSTGIVTNSTFRFNTKGIYTFDSNMQVHDNDFEYNNIALEFFVSPGYTNTVDAINNWWGSEIKPDIYAYDVNAPQTAMNFITGGTIYSPWSIEPHKKKNTGDISNVLFLPGLMGSRLYKKGVFENQLWEPNRNSDVTKLFLDAQGKSIEKDIYTRDVISKTNISGGFLPIEQTPYKDFFTYMDGLVKGKVINSWKPAPYDWRYSPDTILEQGILFGDDEGILNTSNLLAEVMLLAKTSKTKKVTIVTHSNGGFIGKQLMIELKKKNLDMLVDKIVFVAMPEYGTPQAITSLLYGHEQTIAGGLIMNATVAKNLGINMPTAYTLLPSNKYFYNSKNIQIDDIFIKQKSDLDIKISEKAHINNLLLSKANTLHTILDAWIPSPYVSVYQIVGTGLLTVSGMIRDSTGKSIPTYSTSGDGIVQDMYVNFTHSYPRTGPTFTVDLHNTKFKHSDIMNSTGVMDYIDILIRKIGNSTSTSTLPQNNYLQYPDIYTIIKLIVASSSLSKKNLEINTSQGIDILKHAYYSQFDISDTKDILSRYDLFDTDIQYITQKNISRLDIHEDVGNTFGLSVFKKTATSSHEVIYDDINLFQDGNISLGSIGIGIGVSTTMNLNIQLPMLNQKIGIAPTREVLYSSTNQIMQMNNLVATSSEDLSTKISRIKKLITSSNITGYIKIRYIRRLDAVLKSNNIKNLTLLQQKAEGGVVSINMFFNNVMLRTRYNKLNQDYMYLSYVLK